MENRKDPFDTGALSPALVWQRIEAIASRPPQSTVPQQVAALLKPAGILIPFFLHADRPHLLFTKRSRNLPTHRGEISFPGGGKRDGDRDLLATALRETHEELGIDPADIRVIGVFDEVLSIAGYRVTPYIAHIPPPPVPSVNPAEVEQVVEVDVIRLFDEQIHREERMERWGYEYVIHFYLYDDHVIWGMTGGLVHRLLTWLKTPQP